MKHESQLKLQFFNITYAICFDLTRPSSGIHNYTNTPEKYEFL